MYPEGWRHAGNAASCLNLEAQKAWKRDESYIYVGTMQTPRLSLTRTLMKMSALAHLDTSCIPSLETSSWLEETSSAVIKFDQIMHYIGSEYKTYIAGHDNPCNYVMWHLQQINATFPWNYSVHCFIKALIYLWTFCLSKQHKNRFHCTKWMHLLLYCPHEQTSLKTVLKSQFIDIYGLLCFYTLTTYKR